MPGRLPMYEVIYQDLAEQIASGALRPDSRLPSEGELADRYGVSRMTLRQALGQLKAEKLLVRRQGTGTFVAGPQHSAYRRVDRLASFRDDLALKGAALQTEIITQTSKIPPRDVRQRLFLKPRQQAVQLCRVRIVDGVPAAIQDSWLPYAVAPALARVPLVGGSLYRTLSERCGIQLEWAEQEVSAALADEHQAEQLGVPVASPLVTISRLAYADDTTPVEFARSWTRPEFPLLIRLAR